MSAEPLELRAALARRLKDECARLGLTPETLGIAADVHRSTVFTYLSGQRAPDALFLSKARTTAAVDVLYVLTGERERGDGGANAVERALLDRYTDLPPKARQTVDDVLLLAWLASDARRQYQAESSPAAGGYGAASNTTVLVAHEPAPPKLVRAKPVKKPRHD